MLPPSPPLSLTALAAGGSRQKVPTVAKRRLRPLAPQLLALQRPRPHPIAIDQRAERRVLFLSPRAATAAAASLIARSSSAAVCGR